MKLPSLYVPSNLQDALARLNANSGARPIAGGTDLLLGVIRGKISCSEMVNLGSLSELRYITEEGNRIRIGALTTIAQIENSDLIAKYIPAVTAAASCLGSWQIRTTATLGGNLCNAAPSAEMAPPLIALGAEVRLVSLGGDRTVPLESFFVGPGSTVLRPGEILQEVIIPIPTSEVQTTYLRHSLKRSTDIAVVNVAVALRLSAGKAEDVRLVLGAVAPTPIRARAAESILEGNSPTMATIVRAAEEASKECSPISDLRGSADYRREMVRVYVKRALANWAA